MMKSHAQRNEIGVAVREPLIAYVYGETPPDFAAIAAFGFTIVCLDSAASWCTDAAIAAARAEGLTVVPFRMSYAR
jgi:hypothetical protein